MDRDIEIGTWGDGQTDTTPAWNAAIAAATKQARMIRFGPGVYRFATQPNPVPTGIPVQGDGSVGSTPGYGTMLQCDYNIADPMVGFFTLDGSYAPGFAGTGGGFRDLFIEHSAGTSGGCMVKLTGADNNHRAGCVLLFNVGQSVTGSGGMFNKGLVVDGTNMITPGGAGVRTIWIQNCNISCCSDPDSNIWLWNAVHVHATNVHCYPGPGLCGVTISGPVGSPSTNVFFSSSNIDGNLTIDQCLDVNWHGRIGGALTTTVNSNEVRVFGGQYGTRTIAAGPRVVVYD
jgi:hypothetical protein